MPGKSREKTLRFNPRTDIPTIPNAMSIAGAILAWRGAKNASIPLLVSHRLPLAGSSTF